MRNISPLVDQDERNKHIQFYMYRLQFSGYSAAERVNVYRLAKQKYENICKNDSEGTIPMYRSKFWNSKPRYKAKKAKKEDWYKPGGFETVFFVDATPQSKLAKECERILKSIDLKIRVVERAGVSVKASLVKSDPFGRQSCENDCTICNTDQHVNCKQQSVVYRITCEGEHEDNKPPGIYYGETSRSIAERFEEHVKMYNECKETSVFYNHTCEYHNGEHKDLKINIAARCPNSAMLRQITEAVLIENYKSIVNTHKNRFVHFITKKFRGD